MPKGAYKRKAGVWPCVPHPKASAETKAKQSAAQKRRRLEKRLALLPPEEAELTSKLYAMATRARELAAARKKKDEGK